MKNIARKYALALLQTDFVQEVGALKKEDKKYFSQTISNDGFYISCHWADAFIQSNLESCYIR